MSSTMWLLATVISEHCISSNMACKSKFLVNIVELVVDTVICSAVLKKKIIHFDFSAGSRKRGANTAKTKASSASGAKADPQVSLVNVIRFQRRNSLNMKDEEPDDPRPLDHQTVELKSGNNFYLPKRKLVHKPLEPFKLFINEQHALSKLVWLYLLEVR